jgi:hypothetical protein
MWEFFVVPIQTGAQGRWPSFANWVVLCCHVMCKKMSLEILFVVCLLKESLLQKWSRRTERVMNTSTQGVRGLRLKEGKITWASSAPTTSGWINHYTQNPEVSMTHDKSTSVNWRHRAAGGGHQWSALMRQMMGTNYNQMMWRARTTQPSGMKVNASG